MSKPIPVLPLEDMQADFAQGMSVKEISEKYQVNLNYVYTLIKQNKLIYVKPSRQSACLPLEDMQADLDHGMSVKEISRKYQTHPVTVYDLIHQNKLTKLTLVTHKLSQQCIPSMQKDLNKGSGVYIVARKHHVSKQYIYQLIGEKKLTQKMSRHNAVKERIKQLQCDIDAGISLKEISEKHKVNPQNIRSYIHKKLLIWNNPKQQRLKSIQSDLDQGIQIKDIARKHNMNVQNLYTTIRSNKLQRPEDVNNPYASKEKKRLPIADIQADLNDGMSISEISKKYDIYTSYLYSLMKKGKLIRLLFSTGTNMSFAPTKMDLLNLALAFYPDAMDHAIHLASKMTDVEDKRMLFILAKEAISQNISEYNVFYALKHAQEDTYKLALHYAQGSLAAVVALHKKIALMNKDALNLARSKHPQDVQEFVKAALSIQKFLQGQSTSISGNTRSDQDKSAHRTVRTLDVNRLVADLHQGFSKAEAAKRQGFYPDVGRKALKRALQTGKVTEDMLPSDDLLSSTE
jgi:Mor family transcriptional regulator